MPSVTPSAVVAETKRSFDFHQTPLKIEDFLLEAARRIAPDDSEIERYERVIGRKEKFVNALYEEQQKMMLDGRFCPYELLVERNVIIGYSYPRSTDTPEIRALREVAPLHGDMLQAIRAVSPADFETFCVLVMRLLGARHSLKTRLSGDGGADLFASVSITTNTTLGGHIASFEDDFKMLVVGQAKAYTVDRPVGVSAVRELVGTVAMFQFDHTAYEVPFERHLCDPILAVLMTTGVFTSTARDLSRRFGVVLKDGAQLATFLCQHGIGIADTQNGKIFDHDLFLQWLDSGR